MKLKIISTLGIYTIMSIQILVANPLQKLKEAREQLVAGKTQMSDSIDGLKATYKDDLSVIVTKLTKGINDAKAQYDMLNKFTFTIPDNAVYKGFITVANEAMKTVSVGLYNPRLKTGVQTMSVDAALIAVEAILSAVVVTAPIVIPVAGVAFSALAAAALIQLADAPTIVRTVRGTVNDISTTLTTVKGNLETPIENLNPTKDPLGVYKKFADAITAFDIAIAKIDSIITKFERILKAV